MSSIPIPELKSIVEADSPDARVIADKSLVQVIEPRGLYAVTAEAADRNDAQSWLNETGSTTNYHTAVRKILDYRKTNPLFEQYCFRRLTRLAVTDGKVVVVRPKRMEGADGDEAMRRLRRWVTPPFDWFNQHVNTLPGKTGGVQELLRWYLDHLLTAGAVGYEVRFRSQNINGIVWRVPAEVVLYSGQMLGLSVEESNFTDEQWYLRRVSPRKLGEFQVRLRGWDQTDYTSRADWTPLFNVPGDEQFDEQMTSSYRGVRKLEYAEGSTDKYPVPPYQCLFQTLFMMDLLTKDDVATLKQNQQVLTVWTFDLPMMRDLGINWADSLDESSNTVKGAMTVFREARESLLTAGGQSQREVALPNYIKRDVMYPSLELLTKFEKAVPLERTVRMMAGLIFDEDGQYLKEESAQRLEADYLFLRDGTCEPFIQRIYDLIVAENRRWFAMMNGFDRLRDPDLADPFEYRTSRAKNRMPRSGDSVDAWLRYQDRQKRLRLEQEIASVEVRFQMRVSSAKLDGRLEALRRGAERGLNTVETFHEAASLDPDDERDRMRVQRLELRVEPPVGEDLFAAPQTYTQGATGPAGTTVTEQAVSPGRPDGSVGETDEDGEPA